MSGLDNVIQQKILVANDFRVRQFAISVIATLIIACGDIKSQSNDGLLAYYTFDNNTADSSGRSNDGIASDIVFGEDRFGESQSVAAFNGITSSIEIPYGNLLLPEYSYSLYVKPTSLPALGETKFIFSIGGIGGDQTIQFCNEAGSAMNLTGLYGGGYSSDGSIVRITTNALPELERWYHMAVIRSNSFLKLYIDCNLIDSIATNTTPLYGIGTNYNGSLGSRFNGQDNFEGAIDDFRIYDRPLSQNEIFELCGLGMTSTIGTNSIPTLDVWGVIIVALLLSIVGVFFIRKRILAVHSNI